VRTIAAREQGSRGRLQEASVFGRASLALKVDRTTTVCGKNVIIVCSMPINDQVLREKWVPSPNAESDGLFLRNKADYVQTAEVFPLTTAKAGNYLSRRRELPPCL